MNKAEWASLEVDDSIRQINRPTIKMRIAEVVDLNTEREARTKAQWIKNGFPEPEVLLKLVCDNEAFPWYTWAVEGNIWEKNPNI